MVHGLVRWLVLGGAVAATVLAWQASRGRAVSAPLHKRANLLYLISVDVQLVLGLWLWLQSPLVKSARLDMAAAMHDPQLRFFTVEHPALLLLATVAMHVGFALAKRAQGQAAAYRKAFLAYAASLALILLAIPWPFRAVGRALWP